MIVDLDQSQTDLDDEKSNHFGVENPAEPDEDDEAVFISNRRSGPKPKMKSRNSLAERSRTEMAIIDQDRFDSSSQEEPKIKVKKSNQ